jgi:hypothetical protein
VVAVVAALVVAALMVAMAALLRLDRWLARLVELVV